MSSSHLPRNSSTWRRSISKPCYARRTCSLAPRVSLHQPPQRKRNADSAKARTSMSPDRLETREWYCALLSRHASSKTASGLLSLASKGGLIQAIAATAPGEADQAIAQYPRSNQLPDEADCCRRYAGSDRERPAQRR